MKHMIFYRMTYLKKASWIAICMKASGLSLWDLGRSLPKGSKEKQEIWISLPRLHEEQRGDMVTNANLRKTDGWASCLKAPGLSLWDLGRSLYESSKEKHLNIVTKVRNKKEKWLSIEYPIERGPQVHQFGQTELDTGSYC